MKVLIIGGSTAGVMTSKYAASPVQVMLTACDYDRRMADILLDLRRVIDAIGTWPLPDYPDLRAPRPSQALNTGMHLRQMRKSCGLARGRA